LLAELRSTAPVNYGLTRSGLLSSLALVRQAYRSKTCKMPPGTLTPHDSTV
jgi:hypothetical protein